MGVHLIVGQVAMRISAGYRGETVACDFTEKRIPRSTSSTLRRAILAEVKRGDLSRLGLLIGLKFARQARLAVRANKLEIKVPDGLRDPKWFFWGMLPNGSVFSLAFSDGPINGKSVQQES